jgi:putative CocE/NonD family hydrolase
MDEPRVRVFIMGDNVWRDEKEWPLARTKYMNYYFHSGGRANSRLGDGVLSAELPSEESTDDYLYNPRNPVSHGTGALDQQELEKRTDILVYSSKPVDKDLEVTGPVVI